MERAADPVLAELLRDHAAILVTGPRATGKSTTAERQVASVISLQDDRRRVAFAADPLVALRLAKKPVLIDEWQLVPGCLSATKLLVDENPAPGQFVLTGSVRDDLDSPVWPGTGRLIRLSMYGLTQREILGNSRSKCWLTRVLHGELPDNIRSPLTIANYIELALTSGFPEPALRLRELAKTRWLASYVDQLITRDTKDIDAGRDPIRLRRYLRALALNSAGTVDDTTLWRAAQINKKTAAAYDRLLQNLLIAESLPAWTTNRLHRMALAPKRYLVDPGLFVGILGISHAEVMTDGDLMGRVIDTFVTAQIRSELALMTPAPQLHHLRTSQGRHEVDLVIEVGARKIVALEIKAGASPSRDDSNHLRWLKAELGSDMIAGILFHTGSETFPIEPGIVATPIAALWS